MQLQMKGEKKNNHYSLSGSQILILEHMYSMLLGSISSQTTKHVKKIKGEGGGQEEDKDRLERGKKKKKELLCFRCACSKNTTASAAFNDILLVYFLQLHEWIVLETS